MIMSRGEKKWGIMHEMGRCNVIKKEGIEWIKKEA